MKYFILGSNSFAGSSFINFLLKKEAQVVGISRSEEPHPLLLSYSNNQHIKLFRFYQYDINVNFNDVIKLIHSEKPNYIVDFAGQGMVAESWKAPEQWYQTNFISKVRLHNYLKNCDFLDRYLRVSTPEVYGSVDAPVGENQAYNPSTPYAISHAAIDMSLKAYYQQYQFPVILTRFANFYGPHQQLYRIIPRSILYGLIGKKLSLHGGGLSERAFIYGDDVASGIDCALNKGRIGETYHFSAENPISIKDCVKKICNKMQLDFNDFTQISSDRPGKDVLYSMKTEKANNELQWNPKVSLDEGINKTLEWLCVNVEVIKTLPQEYMHKM